MSDQYQGRQVEIGVRQYRATQAAERVLIYVRVAVGAT